MHNYYDLSRLYAEKILRAEPHAINIPLLSQPQLADKPGHTHSPAACMPASAAAAEAAIIQGSMSYNYQDVPL